MSETFEKVVEIMVKRCDVEASKVEMTSMLSDDLGLDSVDIADMVFEIEDAFGIDLPVEDWGGAQETSAEETSAEDESSAKAASLDMQQLCARIDELVAQKATA